jgi:MFS family permease
MPPPPDPLSSSPHLSAPLAAPRVSDAEWLDPRFQKLLGMQMAFGYAFSSMLVVPKYLTTALGATPRQLGELSAVAALAGIGAAPLCGRWLDRGGARSAILLGATLLTVALGTFGFFFAVEPTVYFLRALQGVGNTFVIGGASALVAALVAPKHHARAFGLAGSAALAMNALASYATERFADAFGWGVAFEVAAGASLLAFAFTSAIPRVEAPPEAEPAPHSAGGGTGARGVTFAALAGGAAFATIATFTQPLVLELGGKDVASLFVGYTLMALATRLGLGTFVDRWGRRRTALAALSLYVVTVLAAAAIRPAWLFVLGLGFGAAHGVLWPALNALAVEHAASGRSGSALTRLHATYGIGAMASLWGVGWLVHAIGYAPSFMIVAAFVAGAAFTLRARGAKRPS